MPLVASVVTSFMTSFVALLVGVLACRFVHGPRSVHRIARGFGSLIVCACGAFATAHAQTPPVQARIDTPYSAPYSTPHNSHNSPLVRIRWPATSLARADTARLVALDDAADVPLPFSFVIAPEDQGRTVRPMWLIVRLDGAAPYRLSMSRDEAHGQYRDDPDALTGQRLPPLMDLPVASVSADAWGPIVAVLEEAQATQQSTDTRWRRWIVALAAAGLAALAMVIAFFARAQARRDDVTRL